MNSHIQYWKWNNKCVQENITKQLPAHGSKLNNNKTHTYNPLHQEVLTGATEKGAFSCSTPTQSETARSFKFSLSMIDCLYSRQEKVELLASDTQLQP